jgi:hypothetical protein
MYILDAGYVGNPKKEPKQGMFPSLSFVNGKHHFLLIRFHHVLGRRVGINAVYSWMVSRSKNTLLHGLSFDLEWDPKSLKQF